ncbi:MAG: hypothetical protein COA63_006590 [Methylophaga sp.]|nr:hypothetical protein [Methylophaga sp.]
MKKNSLKFISSFGYVFLGLGFINSAYSMGLRSFVALPVEKGGSVIRFQLEQANDANTDTLITNVAYGFTGKQTLLLGVPYRLSPTGSNRQGDFSGLYRHIIWQQDKLSGTNRLGLLGGVIIPTEKERDSAVQAGFVFTHVKNRHEVDLDALYQVGMENRADSGRYDLSWQYRLFPVEYPEWGVSQEINTVLELNGRWREGNTVTQQLTMGLQWIHQKWILEGGIVKDLNTPNEQHYLISTRFHF